MTTEVRHQIAEKDICLGDCSWSTNVTPWRRRLYAHGGDLNEEDGDDENDDFPADETDDAPRYAPSRKK